MPGQSDFLDGHKERRSVILEEAPLRDMDLLKQFILMHPKCQVDVPMDRIKQRQILRRNSFSSDRQQAFVELEQAGLLMEAPAAQGSLSDTDMNPGTDNIDAASGSQSRRGGSPRAKAYLKRARSELDDSGRLELKRLCVSIQFVQRQR